MSDNKFLPKLSQNLLEILNDEEYYDVTIEVGNDPYVKIFRAHMVILNYRSLYLRRILSTNKKKNDETLTHIKLTNISPEIFQIILKYIYGGKLSLEEYDASHVVKIMVAASELSLQELIPHSQSFLIDNQANWIEQNFISIYQTSFEKKTLISLLRHDNLQMNGIQAWEHVLKWGLAQNPELPSDPANFSKDDFNVLKNTIQQCIPFIKFFTLSSKEFLGKVLPYKKILPKELYKELLKIFLNHDYRPDELQMIKTISSESVSNSTANSNKQVEFTPKVDSISIDSIIIKTQHSELISKWIDRLEITDKAENSYEFKLIYRGSRDGFNAPRFHDFCDNKSHTIAILKVKDSHEILGGYNPIEWKSEGLGVTNDSFIFSFMNNENVEGYLLSRVMDKKHAINYKKKLGPSFGYGDLILLGKTCYVSDGKKFNKCYCKQSSYEKPIRKSEDKFFIEDYEVFQINSF
ncbi:uncharacterized protein OCT59_021093 [Rhizophagus irregularis]|uniref:Kelch-like protein 17 n=2 Tax=Rhizophagus irregularis TaxID=588596 RepID=A0A015JG04_RHIIW|nr:hypothetical protein RirG_105030 [Rhizophagus irregularis DAOM 197198w]UZO02614.1 hypothetical protein OCT59_021093 [Rhizophagus irregularis]